MRVRALAIRTGPPSLRHLLIFGLVQARPSRQILNCALILAIVLAMPLLWRLAAPLLVPGTQEDRPSYLPVLEATRPREPFMAEVPGDLRSLNPDYVIIGDSMAGRVSVERLAEVSHGIVGPLLQFASGPAYWYLVLKNQVVASGVHPQWVFVFFRDTNLTDVMFRLDGPYRTYLDRVALDLEPELNTVVGRRTAGPWRRVYQWTDAAYHVARTRQWLEPVLTAWPARLIGGPPPGPDHLLERVNQAFALEHLRTMAQADLEDIDVREADFAAHVNESVLPLMLSLARTHGLRLGFVRVMRRPQQGRPPAQPPELVRYTRDLRNYLGSNGAVLFDDNDVSELAALPYEDGDHVAREARGPYTDAFWARVASTKP